MANNETVPAGPDAEFLAAANAARRYAAWPQGNKETKRYQRVGKMEKLLNPDGTVVLDNYKNECWGIPVEYDGSAGIKQFKVSVTNAIASEILKAAPTIQSAFKITCLIAKGGKKEYVVEPA